MAAASGSAQKLYSAKGGDVSVPGPGAAHDVAVVHGPRQLRRPDEGQGHVGERSQGHEVDLAGTVQKGADQHIDGVSRRRDAAPDREPDVAHPVLAMDVLGRDEVLHDRPVRSRMDRNLLTAQLHHVQGVLDRLVDTHVARHDGDCFHLDLGVSQRHHQGDRVVGGRVGVDDQSAHLTQGPYVGRSEVPPSAQNRVLLDRHADHEDAGASKNSMPRAPNTRVVAASTAARCLLGPNMYPTYRCCL